MSALGVIGTMTSPTLTSYNSIDVSLLALLSQVGNAYSGTDLILSNTEKLLLDVLIA